MHTEWQSDLVCTVCPDISVQKLRIITVMRSNDADGMANNDDPDQTASK